MEISDEQLQGLKEAQPHAALHRLTHPGTGHTVVVRLPNREEWKKFRADMRHEHRADLAPEMLLVHCLVWPERAVFEATVDRYPGLVETFASGLLQAAGATGEVEKKAL